MKKAFVFALLLIGFVTVPLLAQKKASTPRSKTDGGYYYQKNANPQKISHYMREVGLDYLDGVNDLYEAQTKYSLRFDDYDKSLMERLEKTLDMLMDRMKLNTHAPADKDFLAVLGTTSGMASIAGMGLGAYSRGKMSKEESDAQLSRYIYCKHWVKESIESGIFDDSWHEGCLGDWTEEHKKYD